MNLDEYCDAGNHWIALYTSNNNITYCDSFGVEHISKEIETIINKSTIATNISRIQAQDSIMCWYFCVEFIDFMLSRKTLTDFANHFSPNNFKK